MKRLVFKLSALVLLSVTYAVALSGTASSKDPIKNATKTNLVCICEPSGFEVICHLPGGCAACCPK
jgi:hypothetical protein